MTAKFKFILPSEIKQEYIVDEEEVETVACLVCNKTFNSETALNNHARIEHTELYMTGKREEWTSVLCEPQPLLIRVHSHGQCSPSTENIKQTTDEPIIKQKTKGPTIKHKTEDPTIKQKTEELVSSMEPTSLTTLASEDVSYIIIKADPDAVAGCSVFRKKRKIGTGTTRVVKEKRKREVQPVIGPLECLQPSNTVPGNPCHQVFFSCCEYSSHYREEHTRKRKGSRCQVCEKPLPNPDAPDGKPYTCDLCVNGFETSDQLEEHIAKEHVKQRPHACGLCHKRFTQKGGLQQHMRMHTGDKPYSCTFCPKSFTQKSGLQQHLRIHTKDRPYHCVICSKTFCQSVHLKQHMRTHTNVSPFQCGFCEKRFKQSGHLNHHLKYHDPANMTDEQKKKYAQLIGLMGSELNQDATEHDETQEAVEALENQETEHDETQEAVEALENQEVVVYESEEYVLGTEEDWSCETEQ